MVSSLCDLHREWTTEKRWQEQEERGWGRVQVSVLEAGWGRQEAKARQARSGSRATAPPASAGSHKAGPRAGVHRAAHARSGRPAPPAALARVPAPAHVSWLPAHPTRLGRRAHIDGPALAGAVPPEEAAAGGGNACSGPGRRRWRQPVGRAAPRSPRRVHGGAAQVSIRAGPGDPAPPARRKLRAPHPRLEATLPERPSGCGSSSGLAPPGNFGGPLAYGDLYPGSRAKARWSSLEQWGRLEIRLPSKGG